MEVVAVRTSPMCEADLELAERHRYGDETAFEEVYELYGGMVFNLALRLSGDREEAADLSQETFLKIHRYLGGFRGRSSLKTWVYRVALNCCRSRYKKARSWTRGRVANAEERLEQVPDPRRDPEERAIDLGTTELIGEALAELPPIFREAVSLRDIEGLNYAEIAEVLKVRIGTVRSRIARGRDRLRVLLEESR